MLRFIGAAAAVLLLAGPAMAQWNTQGPSTAGPGMQWQTQAAPYPSSPIYQPLPQLPQTWTGMNLGNGLSTWNGSNGGTVTCQHIGIMTTCN